MVPIYKVVVSIKLNKAGKSVQRGTWQIVRAHGDRCVPLSAYVTLPPSIWSPHLKSDVKTSEAKLRAAP